MLTIFLWKPPFWWREVCMTQGNLCHADRRYSKRAFIHVENASSVTLPRQVWALAPCSRRACHTFFAWLRAKRAWFHFRRCSLKSLQTHLLNLFIQTVTLPPPRTNMLEGAADSAVGHEYCSVSLYRRCYNKLITKIFEHPPGML